YLERLHPTWPVHILSFERSARLAKPGALAEMQGRLRREGIGWTWRRYHKFPSLPATTWDVLQGVRALRRILREEDVGLVHARGRFAGQGRRPPMEFIPCCVDMDAFSVDLPLRAEVRERLGVAPGAALFVYSGSLGTWYLPGEMARFVKTFSDVTGRAVHLLW